MHKNRSLQKKNIVKKTSFFFCQNGIKAGKVVLKNLTITLYIIVQNILYLININLKTLYHENIKHFIFEHF